jgi:hypothetical protein
LINIFGQNNEACSLDTLDACVNPARKNDARSWAGFQTAEGKQIRQEKPKKVAQPQLSFLQLR